MMLLFRSTFITATSTLVLALCAFSMSASAAPQFGRPFLHALDAATESISRSASPLTPVASPTAVVDLVPVETAVSSAATSPSGDPDPDPQVAEATSYTTISSTSTSSAPSTAGTTQAVVNAGTNTNGASRSLYGGTSVVLGVVVSAAWLVL